MAMVSVAMSPICIVRSEATITVRTEATHKNGEAMDVGMGKVLGDSLPAPALATLREIARSYVRLYDTGFSDPLMEFREDIGAIIGICLMQSH